jgi:hypothetical protein
MYKHHVIKTPKTTWNRIIIRKSIQLHQEIWQDRNLAILGFTQEEMRKREHEKLQEEVRRLYDENHQLHPRFTPIASAPLESRLGRSAKQLQQWIHRVQHQIRMTSIIKEIEQGRQLTIRQAYQQAGHNRWEIPDNNFTDVFHAMKFCFCVLS